MFVTCRGEPHDVFGGSSAGRRSSNRKNPSYVTVVLQREGVRGRRGVASLRALSSTTSAHYVTEDVAAKPSVRMLGLCFRTDKCYRSSATRQKCFFGTPRNPSCPRPGGLLHHPFGGAPTPIQSIMSRFKVEKPDSICIKCTRG